MANTDRSLMAALVMALLDPGLLHDLTLREFVRALYLADGQHVIEHGRPVGIAGRLTDAVRSHIAAMEEGLGPAALSESEERALREALALVTRERRMLAK